MILTTLPDFQCPDCALRRGIEDFEVEHVLALARVLQRHLIEAHQRPEREAFRLAEGWARQVCAAVLAEGEPGGSRSIH